MIATFTSVRYHLRTITVLKLSNHCLILLFTALLSVRGETSYKLKIILLLSLNKLNLAFLQKKSYSCLRIILPLSYCALYTSSLCQRRNYLLASHWNLRLMYRKYLYVSMIYSWNHLLLKYHWNLYLNPSHLTNTINKNYSPAGPVFYTSAQNRLDAGFSCKWGVRSSHGGHKS